MISLLDLGWPNGKILVKHREDLPVGGMEKKGKRKTFLEMP
jgi:hypothetical protein